MNEMRQLTEKFLKKYPYNSEGHLKEVLAAFKRKEIRKEVVQLEYFLSRIKSRAYNSLERCEEDPLFIPECKAAMDMVKVIADGIMTKEKVQQIVNIYNKTNEKVHCNGSDWADFALAIRGMAKHLDLIIEIKTTLEPNYQIDLKLIC